MLSSFRKSLTVYQMDGGSYVSGRWVEGTRTTVTILGSVQPASANDISKTIELLPEGRRDSVFFRVYTDTQLNTMENGRNPDIVVINDDEFEVLQEADWHNNVINHYKYIVAKVKES